MKIVLLEPLAISNEVLGKYSKELESQGHEFIAYEKDTNEDVQIERAKDADVIIIANMPLSGKVINACNNLKFINIAFTGFDHVDLEAAKAKGVAVSNASGYATQSVAELVIGYSVSLLRNIPQTDVRCRAGQTKDGLVGNELKDKKIGIVGYGAIGKRTAELFRAFGCNILAYTVPECECDGNTEFVSLEQLLKESDIISLHCPLNDSTKGLINKESISLMKKSSFLINAARGPVVDSQALADALNNGSIAGAAIDVFEIEPPLATDHVLLHSRNTIVTPHIAFASKESMELRAEIIFNSLASWIDGKQVNIVA